MNWLSKLLGIATLRDLMAEMEIRRQISESLNDMINTNHKLIGVNEELIDSNFDIIDDWKEINDVKLISFMVKENTKNIDTLLTYLRKKTKK
jgi:predicted protein tyrosine phosphatase